MSYREELEKLEKQGLRRSLFLNDKQRRFNFSSNDYLGLGRHPDVIKSAVQALEKYGAGGASSRRLGLEAAASSVALEVGCA